MFCVASLLQHSLTACNYDTLVSHISNEITAQLEKAIMKTTFNRVRMLEALAVLTTFLFHVSLVQLFSVLKITRIRVKFRCFHASALWLVFGFGSGSSW